MLIGEIDNRLKQLRHSTGSSSRDFRSLKLPVRFIQCSTAPLVTPQRCSISEKDLPSRYGAGANPDLIGVFAAHGLRPIGAGVP